MTEETRPNNLAVIDGKGIPKRSRREKTPETLPWNENQKRWRLERERGVRYVRDDNLDPSTWDRNIRYRLADPVETLQVKIDECQAAIDMSEKRITESLWIIDDHKAKLARNRARLAELQAEATSNVVSLRRYTR